jgi:hypothetical protein
MFLAQENKYLQTIKMPVAEQSSDLLCLTLRAAFAKSLPHLLFIFSFFSRLYIRHSGVARLSFLSTRRLFLAENIERKIEATGVPRSLKIVDTDTITKR